MKKPKASILPYTALCISLLLTACEDKSQPSPLTAVEKNTIITEQLIKLATSSSAHWLTPELLVLPKSDNKVLYQLLNTAKNNFDATTLLAADFPAHLANKFPHLADFQAYKVTLTPSEVKAWLKQQLIVIALDKNHQTQSVSFVQTGAVIDALYTQGDNDANEVNDLGATITPDGVNFKLWAPTAQKVELLVFNDDLMPEKTARLSMVEDRNTGVWSVIGDSSLSGSYYQYQLTIYHPKSQKIETLITTDPYSLSLSTNSTHSQVVDLGDSSTQPKNWENHIIPLVKNIEDNIFYEVHIRDFSAADSALSDEESRGKYQAFSEQNSYGVKHLRSLKHAGLNNIHLLPTFDIGTVNEDKNQVIDINDKLKKVCTIAPEVSICQSSYDKEQSLESLLQSYDVNGKNAQVIVSELRQFDNYNWGYDPYHYTVPEGSYAINPQGKARLIEFRKMIQSLHGLGFRVIMDVVYNHTHQSGLEPQSVLDKIVPHYYHRLDPISGAIEQSTCCDNTATERVMMAKLMTDSLVTWARDYKIDGFRFDLMGHQTKASMLAARKAVRKVDSDSYFYGEGWNFGEVANNSRFIQASQLELKGTEIGTYSDRLRDAVRGPGNNTRTSQGIGNGLLTQANELQNKKQSLAEYNLLIDRLRIGLAGNLSLYPLKNAQGEEVLGKDIPYGDQPTGYALDPADTINYVSKHDNQTLWDNNQYRLPFNASTKDRVRYHLQSLSYPILAQGIPFLHMGAELLRSKSYLRDSYDYGDWFNKVDFSMQSNNYHIGLPPAAKDQNNWPLIKEVLEKNEGRDIVSSDDIHFSAAVFNDFIKIRMSSTLFRLNTAKQIIEQVKFHNTGKNQQKGLIVMSITQSGDNKSSDGISNIVVLFNTGMTEKTFTFNGAEQYKLHPVQQISTDDVVKKSESKINKFIIPALTTAVFIK